MKSRKKKLKTIKVNGVIRKCPHCGNKIRVNFSVLSDLKEIEYGRYRSGRYRQYKPDYQI